MDETARHKVTPLGVRIRLLARDVNPVMPSLPEARHEGLTCEECHFYTELHEGGVCGKVDAAKANAVRWSWPSCAQFEPDPKGLTQSADS